MKIPEEHEDSVLVSKGTCPYCGEAKAYATYSDGHAFCFAGCGLDKSTVSGKAATTKPKNSKAKPRLEIGTNRSAGRGLSLDTQKRYGYGTAKFSGQDVHVWNLYDQTGEVVRQKVRFLSQKGFNSYGVTDNAPSPNDCQLWGMHVWGNQHDKRVVVTEGEIDAMSVAEASGFRYPVVSINGGVDSAVPQAKANYRWLDGFDEIILWFDADEAGTAAANEVAKLFAIGKVKLARIDGYKDANAALLDKKRAEIERAVYGAVQWSPSGIVNAASLASLVVSDVEVPSWSFPWAALQEVTQGVRRAEVYYYVAGTGIGKSSILNELAHHWLFGKGHTEEPAKIGFMAFETLLRETMLGLMSVDAGKRLHLEPQPKAAMEALHFKLFGEGRVELFDPETAEWGFEPLLGYLRYLVKALGCNIVFIDPLSFIAAQLDEKDERRALDKVSVILSKLAKELNVSLHISHHLTRPEGTSHEEGGAVSLKHVRGSGGIAMFANGAIGFERNQQADGPAKYVTHNRILKWRWTGYTGSGGYTTYDPVTGRYAPIPAAQARLLISGKGGDTAGDDDDEASDEGDY